ncbi:hypothetical protein KGF54_004224 [Candida jiufengensis]|uniref:uncharacterized protein n=1 Tax=Candida jiufengensis TaxID=497108 RepID=UPI0022245710|nr:uncharacterized protein KGF54_004224 [Candida jiufengensis]KAI5951150.1 hypothetical protein KGF54_004224 [Candida jiufengensis]
MFNILQSILYTFITFQILFTQTVKSDEIINNVLYTHSGLDSKVIIREVHEGKLPYEIKLDEKFQKGDKDFNLIVNLDAINHIQNIHDSSKGKTIDDSELIKLAQAYYVPTTKVVSSSILHNFFASIANSFINNFGSSIKYIYDTFIFRIFKYSYYWAYTFTKYTVKLTGWYYGTSTLPIKCYIGLDYIKTLTHGEFIIGWETYTLNDNCEETVNLENIEKILSHSRLIASEIKDNDINYSCQFYKSDSTLHSGQWFAKIRIFDVNKENLQINENIWNIDCEDNEYSKPSKRESIFASIMKFFNTIT